MNAFNPEASLLREMLSQINTQKNIFLFLLNWCTPIILVLGRVKQEDGFEFEASLGDT